MFRSLFTTIFRGSSAVVCALTIPPLWFVPLLFLRCTLCRYYSSAVLCAVTIPPLCFVPLQFLRCGLCRYCSSRWLAFVNVVLYFFFTVRQPTVVQGLLNMHATRSHSGRPYRLRLLRTRDQSYIATCTSRHSQQTDINAPVGFEPANPARHCPQTHFLDRTANGIVQVTVSVQ